MAKIIPIGGASVPQATGSADPSVVEALREALDQALRGEIVAVGVISVRPNGRVGFGWQCPGTGGHALIAGCEYLKHDLLNDTAGDGPGPVKPAG